MNDGGSERKAREIPPAKKQKSLIAGVGNRRLTN